MRYQADSKTQSVLVMSIYQFSTWEFSSTVLKNHDFCYVDILYISSTATTISLNDFASPNPRAETQSNACQHNRFISCCILWCYHSFHLFIVPVVSKSSIADNIWKYCNWNKSNMWLQSNIIVICGLYWHILIIFCIFQ